MQHKAIYSYLYFCPDTSACGCYLLSVDRSAVDLSMTASSLDDALDEFARRKLIARDKDTGEIYVVDWPRWHHYATPAARGALWASIRKIQSLVLRPIVENAYKSIPFPCKEKDKVKDKASAKAEVPGGKPPSSPPPAGATALHEAIVAPTRSPTGIKCWTPQDRQEAAALESRHDSTRIKELIEELDRQGVEPLPSRIARALQEPRLRLPRDWCMSEAGTIAAGRQVNVTANPGETMEAFRQRIRQAVEVIA